MKKWIIASRGNEPIEIFLKVRPVVGDIIDVEGCKFYVRSIVLIAAEPDESPNTPAGCLEVVKLKFGDNNNE